MRPAAEEAETWPTGNSGATKREARKRLDGPAKARKDPEWNKKDHLDPTRASRKQGEAVPKDAKGQAERGSADQTVTSKGHTGTR